MRVHLFFAVVKVVTPLSLLAIALEPSYPKGVSQSRPSICPEKMLRTYIAQQRFGYSDKAIEYALHNSQEIRWFVCMDLGRQSPLSNKSVEVSSLVLEISAHCEHL